MDKERLYEELDNDEGLTDKERRDIYKSEIEEEEDYQQWCDAN